jgi:hypothetical protein
MVVREKDQGSTGIIPWPPRGPDAHEFNIDRYDSELLPLTARELVRIMVDVTGLWEIPSREQILATGANLVEAMHTEERSRSLFENWRDFCQAAVEGMGMALAEARGEEPSGDRDNLGALNYAMDVLGADWREWEGQVLKAGRAFAVLLGEGETEEGDKEAAIQLVNAFVEDALTSAEPSGEIDSPIKT